MPFDVQYWRDSDFTVRASGDEFRACMMLCWASWHQVPAGSIPDDDRVLAALCGLGRTTQAVKEWIEIREAVLYDWVLCDDGRFYHPKVAEKVLTAWNGRQESGVRFAGGQTRLQRLRAEHSGHRLKLKEAGIHMPYNAPIAQLRRMVQDMEALKRNEQERTNAADGMETAETAETAETSQAVSARNAPTGNATDAVIEREVVREKPQPQLRPHHQPAQPQAGERAVAADLAPAGSALATGCAAVLEESAIATQSIAFATSVHRTSVLACPVQLIVDAYHECMPLNPRVRVVSERRVQAISEAWNLGRMIDARPFERYATETEGVHAWRLFFATCAHSKFLTGRVGRPDGKQPFIADLDWLLKEDNFISCIEQKYHRGD